MRDGQHSSTFKDSSDFEKNIVCDLQLLLPSLSNK